MYGYGKGVRQENRGRRTGEVEGEGFEGGAAGLCVSYFRTVMTKGVQGSWYREAVQGCGFCLCGKLCVVSECVFVCEDLN